MSASRLAAAAFALLVGATFAAFFVAQHLKSSPSVIQKVQFATVFSPNGDHRRDEVRFSLTINRDDEVDLAIVDADGDEVRTLVDGRRLKAYERLGLPGVPWDGTDDDGRVVPDGRYRLRITLRGAGRSVVVPRSIRKDTRPPVTKVDSMGPETTPGPELLPRADGQPAQANFRPASRFSPRVRLFRTGPGKPQEVLFERLATGARNWTWDGTLDGEPAPAGTYLVVPQWRDQAGNLGSGVPIGKDGLPILDQGTLPGRGGITVRPLAVAVPPVAVKARDPLAFAVDARQEPFTWSLRRIGDPVARKSGGPKRDPRVTTEAPGGESGVFLLEASAAGHEATVPVAVQSRATHAGTREAPRGVLVVLPKITWAGETSADDDGDGRPDTLAGGGPVPLNRPVAALPPTFEEREAPLLLWLDRNRHRYDLATDVTLQGDDAPDLRAYRGVIVAGDARWLPGRVRQRLRAFVRGGGTLLSVGVGSLRRTVKLVDGELEDPSPQRPADLFGARIGPIVRGTTDLEVFEDAESVSLFEGTDGLLPAVPSYETTLGTGREADALSRAVTVMPEGRTVVVAAGFGDGLVLRTGFPAFPARLATDPATSALMARMWTLLAR